MATGSASLEIRPFQPDDRAACAEIFRQLPAWFGIESANAAYLDGLAELPAAFVATEAGRLVGFTSLRVHNAASAEIEVLAVEPERHRRGIGGRLVDRLEAEMRARGGFRLFHVKTLGPSHPDVNYQKTRAFYLARGFQPLLETTALWGPENPALILVRPFEDGCAE